MRHIPIQTAPVSRDAEALRSGAFSSPDAEALRSGAFGAACSMRCDIRSHNAPLRKASASRLTMAIIVASVFGWFVAVPSTVAAQSERDRRELGLIELQRASGSVVALHHLESHVTKPGQLLDSRFGDLLGWRLLAANRPIDPILSLAGSTHEQSQWRPVFGLVGALQSRDREKVLSHSTQTKLESMDRFPIEIAESAHFDLLRELGLTPTQAGLEVIRARSYDALHTLRDLDRGLTREIDFLAATNRAADAATIRACRDHLREAYLKASRNVVEKLFALNLLNRHKERDELLAKFKKLDYLHNVEARKQLFDRLGDELAWKKVVQPLLENEVAFVENPPDFTRITIDKEGDLTITANGKQAAGAAVRYAGNVTVELGGLRMTCESLLLERDEKTRHATLIGSGNAQITGVPGIKGAIAAERFTFSTDTFAFTLGGAIRIPQREGTLKLTACSINRHGEIRDQRSLIKDFQRNVETDRRLELLPEIAKVYSDDELPHEVRYWLALHLLRPHLTWHAPYLPPKPDRDVREKVQSQLADESRHNAWNNALGGEYWMLADIADANFNRFLKTLEERAGDGSETQAIEWAKQAKRSAFFWRINDRNHADVQRATKLLELVSQVSPDAKPDNDLDHKARIWLTEIHRNNTILTLDITGGYGPGLEAPVVLDTRNADEVALSLYRVSGADELLFATDRIGHDFIFRDHGLQYERLRRDRGDRLKEAMMKALDHSRREKHTLPAGLQGKPLASWKSVVAELAMHHEQSERRRDYEIFDDAEAEHFDDACHEYRERLDKSYRPEDRALSSWQCDRILKVPGHLLKEVGAYILVVEANGQKAYAPLIVDPLSLSMQRCRDGVFVSVHDGDGYIPLEGAKVTARAIVRDARTDKEGVAFAKVAAAGDRAIVVEKDGRFAIGGFGRVFDGIYTSALDYERDRFRIAIEQRARKLREERASVYDDRIVVAAYTDRPTYRPGQQVQFKFIIRKLLPDNAEVKGDLPFRAEDFETQSRLEVPKIDKPFDYSWIDSKGRTIASGSLKLSEFGTAAAHLTLNPEATTGTYYLKVRLADRDRIVADVFAVQNYRRPAFELNVAGLPDKPGDHGKLKLELYGEYYFGKPVEGGVVQIELLDPAVRKPAEEAEAKLDANGKAAIEFTIPARLPSGSYRLLTRLTDASGRSVQRVHPIELKRGDSVDAKSTFANLPRFAPLDGEIVLRTTAAEILASQRYAPPPGNSVAIRQHRFPVKDGEARIRLTNPGWHTLTAGDQMGEIFIYGGKEPPDHTSTREQKKKERERRDAEPLPWEDPHTPRWVDLSDNSEDDTPAVVAWAWRDERLLALLGGYRAVVGDKYRLLVYLPKDKARLVFTCEGYSVRDYHFVTVDGTKSHYHLIELPIRSRCLPHFYLAGHALPGSRPEARQEMDEPALEKIGDRRHDADRDADPRWRRIDVTDPRPRPNRERLAIELKSDREIYRPGDKVNVSLRVKDDTGKPASAEVSLSAIDESIYTFGEDGVAGLASAFADPHPAEGYRAKTWRGVVGRRWQILAAEAKNGNVLERMEKAMQQMQRMQDAAKMARELSRPMSEGLRETQFVAFDGMRPSSSIPLARLRSDFRETAVWLPQMRTDANGEAKAEFTLPDSLTRYRLTAVAIDKQSNVGTSRSTISSRMPLGAQLILPRFAVEKDRFFAFGLIHNQTGRDQDIAIEWHLDGIAVAKLDDGLTQQGARVRGKVRVAAGKSERIAIELKAERAGEARIELMVTGDPDADAEKRILPIHTLGREREFVVEGSLQGKRTLELPAGFEPRTVRLILARGEAVQALEGVGYLIDYPYGCVEQTMSRFLPAVVVREASKRTPIHLSPEVANKLPQVISRGLTRLYRFQHADGGWGWWEHDESNDAMTAYVVYGLALCQRSQLEMDKSTIERGCSYLKQRLKDGKLSGLVEAKAWNALAQAGHAIPADLARSVQIRLDRNSTADERALLALASKASGLRDEAERLARTLGEWKPTEAESIALQLNLRMTFGVPFADCQSSADSLLRGRVNHRWSSTQATASAILALADYTSFMNVTDASKAIRIQANGKEIAAIRDAEALKKLVQHIDVPHSTFANGNRKLEVVSEGQMPLSFTLIANGTERLDQVEARGKEVRMNRRYETLDGKPLVQPLRVGDAFAVRLTIELEQKQDYLIVEDRRPSSCEYADDQATLKIRGTWASTEFRDDRVCLFFTNLSAGKHEIIYYLRAETPGLAHVLPGFVHPMYAEPLHGETGSDRIEIVDRR